MDDFILEFGEIENSENDNDGIDWEWYDEIVAEYDKECQLERQRKDGLLIDFDDF